MNRPSTPRTNVVDLTGTDSEEELLPYSTIRTKLPSRPGSQKTTPSQAPPVATSTVRATVAPTLQGYGYGFPQPQVLTFAPHNHISSSSTNRKIVPRPPQPDANPRPPSTSSPAPPWHQARSSSLTFNTIFATSDTTGAQSNHNAGRGKPIPLQPRNTTRGGRHATRRRGQPIYRRPHEVLHGLPTTVHPFKQPETALTSENIPHPPKRQKTTQDVPNGGSEVQRAAELRQKHADPIDLTSDNTPPPAKPNIGHLFAPPARELFPVIRPPVRSLFRTIGAVRQNEENGQSAPSGKLLQVDGQSAGSGAVPIIRCSYCETKNRKCNGLGPMCNFCLMRHKPCSLGTDLGDPKFPPLEVWKVINGAAAKPRATIAPVDTKRQKKKAVPPDWRKDKKTMNFKVIYTTMNQLHDSRIMPCKEMTILKLAGAIYQRFDVDDLELAAEVIKCHARELLPVLEDEWSTSPIRRELKDITTKPGRKARNSRREKAMNLTLVARKKVLRQSSFKITNIPTNSAHEVSRRVKVASTTQSSKARNEQRQGTNSKDTSDKVKETMTKQVFPHIRVALQRHIRILDGSAWGEIGRNTAAILCKAEFYKDFWNNGMVLSARFEAKVQRDAARIVDGFAAEIQSGGLHRGALVKAEDGTYSLKQGSSSMDESDSDTESEDFQQLSPLSNTCSALHKDILTNKQISPARPDLTLPKCLICDKEGRRCDRIKPKCGSCIKRKTTCKYIGWSDLALSAQRNGIYEASIIDLSTSFKQPISAPRLSNGRPSTDSRDKANQIRVYSGLRCDPCIKVHRSCDHQRPCKRCKNAGRNADRCIYSNSPMIPQSAVDKFDQFSSVIHVDSPTLKSIADQPLDFPAIPSLRQQRRISIRHRHAPASAIYSETSKKIENLRLAGLEDCSRPYLRRECRADIVQGLKDAYWYSDIRSQLENAASQPRLLHVDFSDDEVLELANLLVIGNDSHIVYDVSEAKARISKVMAICKSIPRVCDILLMDTTEEGRGLIGSRSEADLTSFLKDAADGLLSRTPQVLRMELKQPKLNSQSIPKRSSPSMTSLLLDRSIYGDSYRTGSKVQRSHRDNFLTLVEDNFNRRAEWSDCSGDIATFTWLPDHAFISGATAHSDSHNMQYNKPGNLLAGSALQRELHSIQGHRAPRPIVEKGENALPSMRRTQDPWIHCSVTSTAYSETLEMCFTGSYDKTVKIWDTEESSLVHCGTWLHDGHVNFVMTSKNHDLVATAADVGEYAVRVYDPNLEDISASHYDTYSGERAAELAIARSHSNVNWAYHPATMAWGISPSVAHLLLVGYSPRAYDCHDEDIPEERSNTGEICLWNVRDKKRVYINTARTSNVFEVVWHPTQPIFVAATSPTGEFDDEVHTQLRMFAQTSTGTFSMLKILDCVARDINEITMWPTSMIHSYVTASCTDGNTYVWDTAGSEKPAHILSHSDSIDILDANLPREVADVGVKFAAWGSTSKRFYTGSSDGVVKVWDVSMARGEEFVKDLVSLSGGVSAGAFEPGEGRLLVGDATGKIHLFVVNREGDDDDIDDQTGQKSVVVNVGGRMMTRGGQASIIRQPITPGLEPATLHGMGRVGTNGRVDIDIEGRMEIDPDSPSYLGSGFDNDNQTESETAVEIARSFLQLSQIVINPDHYIGAVQGPNYAETGMFLADAHRHGNWSKEYHKHIKKMMRNRYWQDEINLPTLKPIVFGSEEDTNSADKSLVERDDSVEKKPILEGRQSMDWIQSVILSGSAAGNGLHEQANESILQKYAKLSRHAQHEMNLALDLHWDTLDSDTLAELEEDDVDADFDIDEEYEWLLEWMGDDEADYDSDADCDGDTEKIESESESESESEPEERNEVTKREMSERCDLDKVLPQDALPPSPGRRTVGKQDENGVMQEEMTDVPEISDSDNDSEPDDDAPALADDASPSSPEKSTIGKQDQNDVTKNMTELNIMKFPDSYDTEKLHDSLDDCSGSDEGIHDPVHDETPSTSEQSIVRMQDEDEVTQNMRGVPDSYDQEVFHDSLEDCPGSDEDVPAPVETLHIKIIDTDSETEVLIKIERTSQLKEFMNAFCKHHGKTLSKCQFLFKGVRVQITDSPETLGITDNDCIEVHEEQGADSPQ